MNRSSLTMILERSLEFLRTDGLFLLSDDARNSFDREAQRLLQKAYKPGEVLYVGILGGTGVGKSTLINALAGTKISDPSDKRPFTDRAVVYRHKDAPRGLEEISALIRENDALHGSDIIKDLVLLDLPDFDSVEQDNRETVEEIIAFLDCAVWVVSPEKYADAVFYSFVRKTLINRENFTFVFNKADELIGGEPADPHGKLKDVLGDFTFRLKREGDIQQPRVFIISAAGEVDSKQRDAFLQNQFEHFRNFLMVRRQAKEIASVKTINLVEETRHLLNELNAAISPAEKKRLLNRVHEIEAPPIGDASAPNLQLVHGEHRLAKELTPFLMTEDASIRPVKLAMKLFSLGRMDAATSLDEGLEPIFLEAVSAVSNERRSELEKAGARLDSELLLAFRRTETAEGEAGPEDLMNRAKDQASKLFAQKIAQRRGSLGGWRAGWRRLGQRLVLSVPALILILKLFHPPSVEAWLDHPSLAGGLKILVGFLTSIFSSEGLIGLTVLLICELILVFYLAARRTKKIEKRARSLAASAFRDLDGWLEAAANQIRQQRRETVQRIRGSVDHLNALNATFNDMMADMSG